MSGKHTVYVIKVFERTEADYSNEIKMAVNKQLSSKAHVTGVKKEEQSEETE